MDHSPINQNFELNKFKFKFLKEHHTIAYSARWLSNTTIAILYPLLWWENEIIVKSTEAKTWELSTFSPLFWIQEIEENKKKEKLFSSRNSFSVNI
jgi:hypothetical protein